MMAKKRILLLEDETAVDEPLTIALTGEGYVVDHAGTVAEGRSRLDQCLYSLVIADLRLPDGSGLAIAEQGADLGAKTSIMSGYLFELPQGSAQRHELWMKPMRPSEVVWAVRRSIGEPTQVPNNVHRSVTKVVNVTVFDHFVSFELETDSGGRAIVQYREGQVWQNENGIWEIGEDQEPFYANSSGSPRRFGPKISNNLLRVRT